MSTREWHEAARVFDRKLSSEDQLQLAREIVETRSAELRLAYRNIVAAWYGYGTKRDAGTGRRRVRPRPCVTFLVRRKWTLGNEGPARQQLPKRLLAYATINGQRTICAVPTDVECSSVYRKLRPHGTVRRVSVAWNSPTRPETGVVTCAINRSAIPETTYAVSCRHVFGLTKQMHPRIPIGARVHLEHSGNPVIIGTVTSLKGGLRNGPAFSHDAHLAEVADLGALRAAMSGLNLTCFARLQSDIPDKYVIRTPGGNVAANKSRPIPPPFSLNYGADLPDVQHVLLMESIVAPGSLYRGDSGSPVTTRDGRTLLGMHIAGGEDVALMIPAWHLFDPKKYEGLAETEVIGLHSLT